MSPRATLVSAIKGITTHFTFLSKRGRADERALVDSGATENFMDHSVMERSFYCIFTYFLHIT